MSRQQAFEMELSRIDNQCTPDAEPTSEVACEWESKELTLIVTDQWEYSILGYEGYNVSPLRWQGTLRSLRKNIESYIDIEMLSFRPMETFTILEKDIFRVLSHLRLDERHIIISRGPWLGDIDFKYNSHRQLIYCDGIAKFGGTSVIEHNSTLNSIYIMKISDKPRLTYSDWNFSSNNLTKVQGSRYCLYSNVVQIQKEKSTNPIFKLGRHIKFYYKRDFPFIRLDVENQSKNTEKISDVKSFDEYEKQNQ